jgi:hypothetical protein
MCYESKNLIAIKILLLQTEDLKQQYLSLRVISVIELGHCQSKNKFVLFRVNLQHFTVPFLLLGIVRLIHIGDSKTILDGRSKVLTF